MNDSPRKGEVRFGEQFTRAGELARSAFTSGPGIWWVTVFLLANPIAQQFGQSRDWPFGSAIAFLGMGLVLLGLWASGRLAGEKGGELL